MNKSEIIAAAEKFKIVKSEDLTIGDLLTILEALQSSAQLLKQIVVLGGGYFAN